MKTLDELIARTEIEDQIKRITAMLDDHRFELAREIFTDDVAIETPGGHASGIDALIAQAARNHEQYTTQHIVSGLLVEQEGDAATARAEVVGRFVPLAGSDATPRQIGGRYEYSLTRAPQGWRVAKLTMRALWREEG